MIKHTDKISPLKFNKKTLFSLLFNLGFVKNKNNKIIIFKKDNIILAYPNTKLQYYHYYTTRKHLDMNGLLNEKEFDLNFNI